MTAPFVLFAEEAQLLKERCDDLQRAAYARAVFLIDRDGQLITTSGESERFDSTSLASLTAGKVAATDGIAKLIGEERGFPTQLHEGERESVHLSLVGERFILVMIFDKRSSSGLVRLRARRAQEQLEEIFERARRRSTEGPSASFSELSDDDIDNLFRDS